MPVPEEIYYTAEGETVPGVLLDVKLGECFLMTTLEDELVLLRLISVDNDKRCCAIQWIKANSGSSTFSIPKGELIQPEPEPSRGNTNQITVQQNPSYKKELTLQIEYLQEQSKAIDIHLTNREKVIKYCMDTLSNPIDASLENIDQRIAIRDAQTKALLTIGKLHAIEASTLLSSMIDFNISGEDFFIINEVSIDNTKGCVPTLFSIGKAGAVACLKEIINLSESDWDKPFQEKPILLLAVILRVEGENFTRQILDDFKENLIDENQIKNIEKAIALLDEAISYDGPKEDIYTQLKKELIKESENKQENNN